MEMSKADQITERASNTGKCIAVFLFGAKTKCTATTTELFAKGMQSYGDNLVGIYNGDADPRWICDDVAYMRGVAA